MATDIALRLLPGMGADARMFREEMDLPGRVVRVRVTEIAPPKRRKGAKQGK